MQALLPIFASLGWGAALGLFAIWLLERLSQAYATGSRMLRHLEAIDSVGRDAALTLPIVVVVEKLTPFFLPAVLRLAQTDRFGVGLYLRSNDRQLKRAGLRATLKPEKFLALSLTFALVVAATVFITLLVLGARYLAVFAFLMISVFCFSLPGLLLANLADRRVLTIEKRLPFAIEFILLSMQANTSLPISMETYCGQFGKEPLGIEFRQVLGDLALGTSFGEALQRMAERLQSDDITAFVAALNTGIKEGQPMQQVLKVQADVARQRRFHNAEQIAKAANANATPFLILAAVGLLILLIGPLIISMTDESLF